MVKLELKNNIILWSDQSLNWVINFKTLTNAYISEKHPYTKKDLTKNILTKIESLIKQTKGLFWFKSLLTIKKYKKISIKDLHLIKNNKLLGSGKNANVYNYNNLAVKVVKHVNYKDSSQINGKAESEILLILKNEQIYNYKTPNIILMYQYTLDKTSDYIVLEKLDKTLWNYLQEEITDYITIGIILQVLFTLAVLQKEYPGFRHNDIKVDNILLDYTQRTNNITIHYNKKFWKIPTNVPLVKIADFDYACIPKKCENPKVGTTFSKTFGCTRAFNKIYDVHLFLNSIYSYRKNCNSNIINWLQEQLPINTRGIENIDVKYGRLKNPNNYKKIISTPEQLLKNKLFSPFITKKPEYPIWGL